MSSDYYQTLGIDRSATKEDIKRAYRKLAHQYHPDKGGDQERFKEVNEAYQVLGNEEKRRQYDQFGSTFEGGGNPFQGGYEANFGDFGDLGDIFSQFFGGASRRGSRTRQRGSDIGLEIDIPFKEMVFGAKREFPVTRFRTCKRCEGNLAEPGTPIATCKTCGGTGTVQRQMQTMLGSFVQRTVCPDCRGEGKKAEKLCTGCGGDGRTRQSETLVVDIPTGIEHGTRLRISGEGEAPSGGGDLGDLYILVRVQPHKEFVRDGVHIRSSVAIPFVTAALGGTVRVQTVDGEEKLHIPSGTQSGAKLRISGKGIKTEPVHGDHIVTVGIDVPKKLTRKQKDLLQEFKNAESKSGIRRFLG